MKKIILALLLLAAPAFADTINLAWDKVTLGVDDLPLQELTGYKVYKGTAAGDYSTPLVTITPATENYSFEQSIIGTYFFVVTAYNSVGESGHSNEVSAVVNPKVPAKVLNLRIP